MDTLKKYMETKGIKTKGKVKPAKPFANLSANEKWALVEQMLKDFKYIEQ